MTRRHLNRLVGQMRRERARGVNAAAWFASQSFNSGTRGDMPFERIPMAELDKAGAALLPKPAPAAADEPEPNRCAYCGEPCADTYCSTRCTINAQGDN